MASSEDATTLTARCLCNAHVYSTKVPNSNLPLKASACHCNSCRHNLGTLYHIGTPWPEPYANVDTSSLKTYSFTPNYNIRFCGTCSTPMFFEGAKEPHFLQVLTGTIDNVPGDIIKITRNIFIGDTLDGGASPWLRNPNADGTPVPRFLLRTEELPSDWPTAVPAQKPSNTVPIRCHCRGIDFLLHRADFSHTQPQDMPWYVDATTQKLRSGFCACDSCRLFTGTDMYNYFFASLAHMTLSDSTTRLPASQAALKAAVDAGDAGLGTLAYYASSGPVQRYFCRRCSARVFYVHDDRDEVVDVAVGLLEAGEGARAEGWVAWGGGGVSAKGDVQGGWREGFVGRLERGSRAWGKGGDVES
ncbi:hypothetical protein EJ04DRAFT_506380 [Polyplosphaeria fusca]|uniref:CENP-V/GFA domain-containing protein n=1 Tax=Polyplosphaeria fusca TaxID=682080 RepID=A0A9P4QGU3_9PLEO|nr:hypothetical protein EJ04DRAFT_506380 [Polyplosphaeria fusca]